MEPLALQDGRGFRCFSLFSVIDRFNWALDFFDHWLIEFCELPKTISGKIRRAELRQQEAARRAGGERRGGVLGRGFPGIGAPQGAGRLRRSTGCMR
jgi:hypothetical protein